MPIEVRRWLCQYCKEEWGSSEDAEECERRHKAVNNTEYVYEESHPYPDHILVEFSDGQHRTYWPEQ